MECYILLETAVGSAKVVTDELKRLVLPEGINLVSTNRITGPYDVIVKLRGEDRNRLVASADQLNQFRNVVRSTTCPVEIG